MAFLIEYYFFFLINKLCGEHELQTSQYSRLIVFEHEGINIFFLHAVNQSPSLGSQIKIILCDLAEGRKQ